MATLAATEFTRLLVRRPEVALALLRSLAADVRRLDVRVVEFSTMPVRGRILAELLRLAREVAGDGTEVLIEPAPSLSELSSRASTHREAVSRELSRLAQIGVLKRESGGLRILSIPRLKDLAGSADLD